MNVNAVIIVAMDDEAAPFLARASTIGESWQVGHAVYRRVTLAGHPVLLVRSGIGLVNAAGAATSAILATERARSGGGDGSSAGFGARAGAAAGAAAGAGAAAAAAGADVAAGAGAGASAAAASSVGAVADDAVVVGPIVISAGTAGGVGSAVRVGDVVVGSEYINVDADARVFGYELGQVPKMPALYRAAGAHIEAAGRSSLAAALPSALPESPRTLADSPELLTERARASVHVGLVVSSYSFVTELRAADIVRAFPGALATDMESVSLAQTCHVHGRAFLSVRGISDLCGPTGTEFLTHVDDAADRSAEVVIALFEALMSS
ncbi:MAG: hypothetical protein JWQ64_1206 [Subtercola sp.]|nr:hypothetical protein [Subtercola sp.]